MHWLPGFLHVAYTESPALCTGTDFQHFVFGQVQKVRRMADSTQRTLWYERRLVIMRKQAAKKVDAVNPLAKPGSRRK